MNEKELNALRKKAEEFHKQYLLDNRDDFDNCLMNLRLDFIKHFDLEYLTNDLTIENYSIGDNKKDTFSYRLEQQLSELGSVRGGTSEKFVVYFSNKRNKYTSVRSFSYDVRKAFPIVKDDLIKIYNAAQDNKIEEIEETHFWYIVKYKIYWTYNPDYDIPVFKKEHVDSIIKKWGIQCSKDNASKRKALYDFKTSISCFKKMTNLEFMRFIYSSASGLHLKGKEDNETDPLDTPQNISLENFKGEYVEDSEQNALVNSHRFIARKNVDYDKVSKKKKNLGTFGEMLIANDESSKLKTLGVDKKVEHSSLERGDGLGYDVLSFDELGNTLYIEVKTTTTNRIDNFFITENERLFAEKHKKSYRLYRIYDLNIDSGTYKIVVFTYDSIIKRFKLEPKQYLVTGRTDNI